MDLIALILKEWLQADEATRQEALKVLRAASNDEPVSS
jgi:hypothetical protein